MSLINDMLKDLDKRRARHTTQTDDIFAGVQPLSERSLLQYNRLPRLFFWITVVCIIGVALYLGLRWQATERQLLLAAAKVQPVATQIKPATVQPKVATTQPEAKPAVATVAKAGPKSQGKLSKTPVELTLSEQADVAYQQAQQLMVEGDTDNSIAVLLKILAALPAHHDSRQLLVTQLVKQGQIQQAEEVLRAGLKIAPKHLAFVETLAHLYVDKKHYQKALTVLSAVHPLIEKHPQYYAFMAAVHEHLGNYSTAVQLYETLLHIQPTNSVWWLGFAISLEGIGANDSAIKAYKHAQMNTHLQPQLRIYIHKRLNALES